MKRLQARCWDNNISKCLLQTIAMGASTVCDWCALLLLARFFAKSILDGINKRPSRGCGLDVGGSGHRQELVDEGALELAAGGKAQFVAAPPPYPSFFLSLVMNHQLLRLQG